MFRIIKRKKGYIYKILKKDINKLITFYCGQTLEQNS